MSVPYFAKNMYFFPTFFLIQWFKKKKKDFIELNITSKVQAVWSKLIQKDINCLKENKAVSDFRADEQLKLGNFSSILLTM